MNVLVFILIGLSVLVSGCNARFHTETVKSLIVSQPADISICPTGGYVLTSGLDWNKSGILDAGEIDSTAPVCNSVAAPAFDFEAVTVILACGNIALLCRTNGGVLGVQNAALKLLDTDSYVSNGCQFDVEVGPTGTSRVTWSDGSGTCTAN
jgi:hypothetical protein